MNLNDWFDRDSLTATPKQNIDRREIFCYLKDGRTKKPLEVVLHSYEENDSTVNVDEIIYGSTPKEMFDDVRTDIEFSLKEYGFKTVNF